jgi:hypothetical protein
MYIKMPSVSILSLLDYPIPSPNGYFHPAMAAAAYRRLSPLLRELFGSLPAEKQQFLYKLIRGAMHNTKAAQCSTIVFESFKAPLLILQNTRSIVPFEERTLYIIRLEDGWHEWRSLQTTNTGCAEFVILGLVFAIGFGLAMTYRSTISYPCHLSPMPIAEIIRAFH